MGKNVKNELYYQDKVLKKHKHFLTTANDIL
jgi:hypothetical protein